MCKWGTDTLLLVPMPANLSHTGEFRWAVKGVDSCIAPIVQALNDAGIYTSGCCCGHGKAPGNIHLHDGRIIEISSPDTPDPYEELQAAVAHYFRTLSPASKLALVRLAGLDTHDTL